MSKKAKICFLIAFLALVIPFAIKFLLGAWLNLNSVLLGVAGAAVVLAVVFDWTLYWEFLTMRTTKHGLNMGAMIALAIALLVCVNFLANRHNKTWDFTKERLNSLSEQSTKLLDGLKEDLEVKVFYKGPSATEDRQRIKSTLATYQEHQSKVKSHFYNAYVETALALQYLKDLPDGESVPVVVFVEHNGKKIRVEPPFDEASFTSAMIKATRQGERKIYFVKGHGEKDVALSHDQGLSDFATSLKDSSFQVEGLNLIETKEIPKDAAVVAIVGPQSPFLESELQWLRDYLKSGGKVFIALDPGQRHNLANLTKSVGVQFENNFVLTKAQIVGGGPATIIGNVFNPESEVTSSLPHGSSFAVFPLASEVKAASDKEAGLNVKEIVRSNVEVFTVTDISRPITDVPDASDPVTIGLEVSGTAKAIVFGDSDFLSNRGLMLGVNRDLALNAFALLADQKDLISIKPKMPEGTMVVLTSVARIGVIFAGITLPLGLLITSGVIWFRRRGA